MLATCNLHSTREIKGHVCDKWVWGRASSGMNAWPPRGSCSCWWKSQEVTWVLGGLGALGTRWPPKWDSLEEPKSGDVLEGRWEGQVHPETEGEVGL
jgi:hypothetical protein